jgi:hypothetical protein
MHLGVDRMDLVKTSRANWLLNPSASQASMAACNPATNSSTGFGLFSSVNVGRSAIEDSSRVWDRP